MKKQLSLLLFSFMALACNDTDETQNDVENLTEQTLTSVAYGNDAEQKMDVYLPANRTSETKVFVLVHGGGWSGGSRADMAFAVPMIRSQFPGYAIVNIDYRLGTAQSPGFPKQIEDIQKALLFLRNSDYQISDQYGLIGASAGAHLSLLYAYHYDDAHRVKAICSIVGPTDFTDPAYTGNPLFQFGLTALVGNANYLDNPEIFIEASPRTHISAQSPPTILFNGGQDPLIPVTQASRLTEKLEEFGVYNEAYLYPNGGHGDWDALTWLDFQTKMTAFFRLNSKVSQPFFGDAHLKGKHLLWKARTLFLSQNHVTKTGTT